MRRRWKLLGGGDRHAERRRKTNSAELMTSLADLRVPAGLRTHLAKSMATALQAGSVAQSAAASSAAELLVAALEELAAASCCTDECR